MAISNQCTTVLKPPRISLACTVVFLSLVSSTLTYGQSEGSSNPADAVNSETEAAVEVSETARSSVGQQFMESVNLIREKSVELPAVANKIKREWRDESKTKSERIQGAIETGFGGLVEILESLLFFQVPILVDHQKAPLILLVLVLGGIFFTLRWGFINVRLFGHCINVIRGKYDHPDDEGEITHFQALTSALSATVGLGNIAGVAVAISMGGAGAVFWMWLVAFFGMSLKFTSCSFAQIYRLIKPDGSVLGGPMVYLDYGFRDRFGSLWPIGKFLGVVYACFTVMAAFGGGNMFQGNQTYSIINTMVFSKLQGPAAEFVQNNAPWICGVVLAILVGLVIIGGIRRIGEITSKLVPLMCFFYCLCCLLIILSNASQVPDMFRSIFQSAFRNEAMFGGIVGVLLTGAKRAAFSNEAGLGSAAIAHAAARTDEPVREGVVAMIGPFIDTIVVCTMTALTILITKAHLDPETLKPAKIEGIELTATAFSSLAEWVPYLLCVAVFVFAYSTMISWSYYGERAVEYLVGSVGIVPYRIVYVLVIVFGPIVSLKTVVDFSDMMLLSMAFPNILGMILLSGILSERLNDYVTRLRSGEMRPVQ